ncbi:MAG: hypothetical protein HY908_15665, partial [Myxococcales bacterium]|nr:hypothetical protein [Myxococcales bacterium]
ATSGSAEAGGDGDDGGVPAALDVIGSDLARHRSLVVVSASEAYVAGAAGDEGSSARVWRFDVDRWSPVELPGLTGALEGLARTADGTLWLATRAELWKKPLHARWERVPLPTEVAGAVASGWELYAVGASGDTVWVSARAVLASGERRVVLALGAGGAAGSAPIVWE